VTGILFLLTTFLAPLVAVIPYEAATPALIIVGFLMTRLRTLIGQIMESQFLPS
jgi:xanthine/uracil/vitamin C permease (AzgA family)